MSRAALGLSLAVLFGGCDACHPTIDWNTAPPLDLPKPATISSSPIAVPAGALAKLTAADRELVERHLRTSLAWTVFEQRGQRFAMRRQKEGDGYVDGSNGFHSRFDGDLGASPVLQTRVLLGLDGERGFGALAKVTRAQPGAKDVVLTLRREEGQPGDHSALVVETPSGITLEVFEQAEGVARTFTPGALVEVEAELAAVLARRDELAKVGYLAGVAPPGSARKSKALDLEVTDGMQGGMYGVTAWVNPGERGTCFVRAFYTGARADGDRLPEMLYKGKPAPLSAERVTQRTERLVGWAPDPGVTFRYAAEVMIFEGDWSDKYEARFEVWFRGPSGERKLGETTRRISGWQR